MASSRPQIKVDLAESSNHCKVFWMPDQTTFKELLPQLKFMLNQQVWISGDAMRGRNGEAFDVRPYMPCPPEVLESLKATGTAYSTKLAAEWKTLNAFVNDDRFVSSSAKFKAMSLNARRELLQSVCKNIPQKHRPDLEAFVRGDDAGGYSLTNVSLSDAFTKARTSYLVPGINVEDLKAESAEGTVLMDWVKVRGTGLPSSFAHKDLDGAFFGTVNNAVKKETIPGAYFTLGLLFSDIEPDDDYAQVGTRWDLAKALEQRKSEQGTKEPPQPSDIWALQPGLLVLEIQCMILGFMNKCCKAIACVPMSQVINKTSRIAKSKNEDDGSDDKHLLASNSASLSMHLYGSGGAPDLLELRRLAIYKKEDAAYHIEMLESDPHHLWE